MTPTASINYKAMQIQFLVLQLYAIEYNYRSIYWYSNYYPTAIITFTPTATTTTATPTILLFCTTSITNTIIIIKFFHEVHVIH